MWSIKQLKQNSVFKFLPEFLCPDIDRDCKIYGPNRIMPLSSKQECYCSFKQEISLFTSFTSYDLTKLDISAQLSDKLS